MKKTINAIRTGTTGTGTIKARTTGTGTIRTGEYLYNLYKNDKQVKKYIDYKMEYIKGAFIDTIKDLFIEVIQYQKEIENQKKTLKPKEIKELKAYYYQTPKTLNDIKGIKLKTLINTIQQDNCSRDHRN